MYDRMAKCKSSPPSIAFVRLFFTVCMNLSAWPLDCAFVGDVILWSICQSLMKSLNSCDINCVPPSEIIHFEIPTIVKISFRTLITLSEQRLCSFLTTGWEGFWGFDVYSSALQPGAMRSWSWHQKYERDSSISLYLFSSLLLNWPMLEICNVLCTSHCVVFIMFPSHGTGSWEGAFNQQGKWTNYWWWFQNKWFIEVPKLLTYLVWVTGLPGPVTRIHKYYKLI